jgi:peptidyl-prolyl cis-trans isomerase B (cyclophilin B)
MHLMISVLLPFVFFMMAASCDEPKSPGGSNPQDAKSRPTTGPSADKSGKADYPVVKFETTEGTITLELNRLKAPVTVENFLSYTRKGYFDGTVFHRIIETFMIQGGGWTEELVKKPGADKPIKNEADNGLKNEMYTIAMARTNDPDSATSEFFINTGNNTMLNHTAKTPRGWGYCVFGKVKDDASQKVVDAIKKIPVVSNPMMGGEMSKPTKLVKVTKASIVSE